MDLGLDAIERHEAKVLDYAHKRLSEINSVRIVGTAKDKASILSFGYSQDTDAIHVFSVEVSSSR